MDPKDTKVLQRRRRRLQYSGMDTVTRGLKNAAKILEVSSFPSLLVLLEITICCIVVKRICTSWRFWKSLKQSLRLKGRKKRMKKEKVMMKLMNLRDTIFSKKQHSQFLTHPLCTSSTATKHLTPPKHII
ncbi:uncharacterized protein LOC108810346 isoform X4 [Raphanus sativus]|uniref:Uncharacterized protein LOC108810346 isoform X4 n=1 Tax=Raphanus sativus TaxID=3726 RepID=A0A6J0JQZ9_RAPSA|nr:uncharacterized protein LOC108810346 isoform X4 [Raphanus sativus]